MRNVTHSPRHLNIWSPADGGIWGGFRGVTLMRELVTGSRL